MGVILPLGLAVIIGLLSTRLMKLVKMPNVTGFLVAGILIGPSVLGLISKQNVAQFDVIVDVALGFIAFSIGSSFKLKHMREIGKNVLIITVFQALATVIVVDAVLIILSLFDLVALPVAITLGAIATATAPAATLMVVRQYKARGPVTDTLLPVVAGDDAVGLMVFSVSLAIAKVIATGSAVTFMTFFEPILEIFLSLVVGFALGTVLALAMKLFKSRANRLTAIVGIVLVGVALSDILKLSSLLTCMMIGAAYCNLNKECDKMLDIMDRWTHPLFMLFFIISGADLNLSIIPSVGLIGVIYIAARSIGKIVGASLGAASVKADVKVKKYLGFMLLPQAGVAIGMAQIVLAELPAYGGYISTIVLCATLVYELIGPVITKWALKRAGEIESPEKNINGNQGGGGGENIKITDDASDLNTDASTEQAATTQLPPTTLATSKT